MQIRETPWGQGLDACCCPQRRLPLPSMPLASACPDKLPQRLIPRWRFLLLFYVKSKRIPKPRSSSDGVFRRVKAAHKCQGLLTRCARFVSSTSLDAAGRDRAYLASLEKVGGQSAFPTYGAKVRYR